MGFAGHAYRRTAHSVDRRAPPAPAAAAAAGAARVRGHDAPVRQPIRRVAAAQGPSAPGGRASGAAGALRRGVHSLPGHLRVRERGAPLLPQNISAPQSAVRRSDDIASVARAPGPPCAQPCGDGSAERRRCARRRFTRLSSTLPPEGVSAMLTSFFQGLDALAAQLQVHKASPLRARAGRGWASAPLAAPLLRCAARFAARCPLTAPACCVRRQNRWKPLEIVTYARPASRSGSRTTPCASPSLRSAPCPWPTPRRSTRRSRRAAASTSAWGCTPARWWRA